MARIGLIAGEGKLPMVFLRLAKANGDTVIAFGLKGVTDPELARYADKMHWLDWGSLQKGLLLLVTERIKKIILLGKLRKDIFFKEDKALDDKAKKMLDKLSDKKDYAILNEVDKLLKKVGVEVIDSTIYFKELIPSKGTLTRRAPTESEWADINYGSDIAKKLSGFDIGQTMVIKDKTVIAVEAMEGTDATISRAGSLARTGFVVVKVARPDQDMRFDVPLVGLDTLKALIGSGGTVLALEEKKTLLMDREELINLADQNSISIVII